MRVPTVLTALLLGVSAPALAVADLALVIAAPGVERLGLLGSTDLDPRPALRAAGFDVISADAGSAEEMRGALSQLLARVGTEPRVVVHLTGAFVQGGGRGWLVETEPGIRPDLATIDGHGLSLDTILSVAAALPGGAIVALGDSGPGDLTLGPGLSAGVATGPVPQGVTVFQGPAAAIARLVRERVTTPGLTPAAMAEGLSGVTLTGFAGRAAFLPEGEARPIAPPDPAEAERAIWQAAQAQDDLAAYRGYLDRYPDGLFADEALAAIEAIQAEPERDARLAEEALALSRDARRRIQTNLTLLDFNPRGVDGIFGGGTRAAIKAFQIRNGFPETGYLDRIQIERLALQAERRQAEIEAERERQRLERERQDRAAWEATGAAGDEAGLRTYLRLYPDGLFAPEAKRMLAEIERVRKAEEETRERIVWEETQRLNTVEAYQNYLLRYPEGAFAAAARARIAEMTAPPPDPDAEARAAEERLGLPAITLLLVERRLTQMGFDAGRVDGELDAQSRAAIRAYQSERGLPVTGFLSETTLARMLTEIGGGLQSGR